MKHVSATQVGAFNDCQRKWYMRYVVGLKTPRTPQQELGTSIHASLEHYLLTGEIRDDAYKEYVEAALPFLPPPKQPGHLIEHKFLLPTFKGGPLWMGVIDLGIDEEPPIVCDHKTTSDFRYAKTPEEMERDTQLGSYAKWVQTEQQKALGYSTGVIVQLLYLHTRRKTMAKRVKHVETVLTPEQVSAIWKRDLEVVRQMVVAEQVKRVEDLPPTTSACMKYGGCPYRSTCGLGVITNPGKKRKNDMSSFLERMKAKKAAEQPAASGGNNDPSAPSIPPSQTENVVPDDAAPRTTPVPTEEEKAAAAAAAEEKKKKSRGRPKLTAEQKEANKKKRAAERLIAKAQAAKAEADAAEAAAKAAETPAPEAPAAPPVEESAPAPAPESPPPASVPATAPPAAIKPSEFTEKPHEAVAVAGFTLYIDCWPVKGNGARAILFDDWITAILHDINKEVDVADYRLLGFQQEKLALQAGLEKHIDEVPPVLIVSTASSVAKDALQTLIPHAAQVIRAMR
jgi:hypothetical protein